MRGEERGGEGGGGASGQGQNRPRPWLSVRPVRDGGGPLGTGDSGRGEDGQCGGGRGCRENRRIQVSL